MKKEKRTFIGKLERIGNKLPHTMMLFLYLVVAVILLSCVLSLIGLSAVDPVSDETVTVVNLLSLDGLTMLLTGMVRNFANFPILGVTLVVGIAMGLCEMSGFFRAVVRFSFSGVRPTWIAFFVSFLGVFMCSFDGAVSHVVVPTIAASIYLGIGKNPLVGIISGYAAAATGAAMEFVPAFWQVALTPLTIEYAQLMDPSFNMPLMSDYFVMLVVSALAVVINTFVTVKIIEPRFGPYNPSLQGGIEVPKEELTDKERSAVKASLWGVLIYIVILIVACMPTNSFMRSADGSLVVDSVLMSSFDTILFFLFFIPGFIYTKKTGQGKTTGEVVGLMAKGLEGLTSFIVLVLVISQFIALFDASNLARVLAILGGQAITSLTIPPLLIIILVFLFYAIINLFIVSGSTKFLIFGSILVPMFMQLNIHPAFAQVVLRLADGSTNQMSPLNSFFPVVVSLTGKYDPSKGAGNALSCLTVYALWNIVGFLLVLLLFYFTGWVIGIGGAGVWLH